MKFLQKNLKKHLEVLCKDTGPRYYWGPGIRKGAEYIKTILSGYSDCVIKEEYISLPFMKNEECTLEMVSPEEKSFSCLPWAGFLPYFPASQEGRGKGIELIEERFKEKNLLYSKKAFLMDITSESAFLWDIMDLEKYDPPVIILADRGAKDFTSLKYGTSDLLINIMLMPLLKRHIPKILISACDGDLLRKKLEKGENIFINYSCFTSEERTQTINIEASFSPSSDIMLWAHYDTAWESPGCPGANDNASSVSVALECARLFHGTGTGKRLKIVFAGAEECSGFSGLSYFMDSRDFLDTPQGRMALMIMSMRVHERVLPVVKPLVKSAYFHRLIKYSRIKDIKACLELECLGRGDAFYLLTPVKSLFARYYKKVSAGLRKPLLLSPQNLGLETHWLSLCKNVSSGVLTGSQEGYPFHTPDDTPSGIDFNMMKEAILIIYRLLNRI